MTDQELNNLRQALIEQYPPKPSFEDIMGGILLYVISPLFVLTMLLFVL